MRTKVTEINKKNFMYGLSLYFINRTDRFSVLFYLKSILGYPLNPGLAVSTDPNYSVHVHQKYLVPYLKNAYIWKKKSLKLGWMDE